MRAIDFHGRTRAARERQESADAFGAYPELGLFVVVDAGGDARAASSTLAAFEHAVSAAYAALDLDGALMTAVRRAHAALAGHATVAFAAVLFHDEYARVAWSGNCRVYGPGLEIALLTSLRLEAARESCIGGERLEVCERFMTEPDLGTFLLATDGFHHRARSWAGGARPYGLREDIAEGLHQRPLEELGDALLECAGDEEGSAVLLIRTRRIDPPPDIAAEVERELELFRSERQADDLVLESAQLRGKDHAPGIGKHRTRLVLAFACGARRGERAARSLVDDFTAHVRRRRPELGGPHTYTVDPILVVDAQLAERKRRLHAFVSRFVSRYRGISTPSPELIAAKPRWSLPPLLTIYVVRDDMDGAADETVAEREATAALRQHDARLAEDVTIIGDYCK